MNLEKLAATGYLYRQAARDRGGLLSRTIDAATNRLADTRIGRKAGYKRLPEFNAFTKERSSFFPGSKRELAMRLGSRSAAKKMVEYAPDLETKRLAVRESKPHIRSGLEYLTHKEKLDKVRGTNRDKVFLHGGGALLGASGLAHLTSGMRSANKVRSRVNRASEMTKQEEE